MNKEVLLKEASRNDLINELFTRESITSIQINEGDAAKITTKYGNVSVNGESNIFVINPNKSIRSTFNYTDKIHIAQNVTLDDKENTTTENSDANKKTIKNVVLQIDAHEVGVLIEKRINELLEEMKKIELPYTQENTTTENSDVQIKGIINPNEFKDILI